MGLGEGPGMGGQTWWEVEMGVPSLRSRPLQLKRPAKVGGEQGGSCCLAAREPHPGL